MQRSVADLYAWKENADLKREGLKEQLSSFETYFVNPSSLKLIEGVREKMPVFFLLFFKQVELILTKKG